MSKRHASVAIVLLVGLVAGQASALDFENKTFYGQGMVVLPMGDWGDFVNTGFGGGLGMRVPHAPQIAFRGEVSYLTFGTDADFFGAGSDVSASSIPIMALIEYDMEASPIYLVGGIGFSILSVDITTTTPFGTFSGDGSSTELSLAAGAGYRASEKFAVEGRLNLVSDANNLSIAGVFGF